MIEWCQFISKANHSASQQSKSMPQPLGQRSWTVLWRPIRPSRTNTKKDVLFTIGDWNAKVGSQEIPGVTGKFGLGVQNVARPRLAEFCQENTLVIANTLLQQQETILHMDITRWSITKNHTDYILCSWRWRNSIVRKNKTGSWLWLRSWAPYCKIQA